MANTLTDFDRYPQWNPFIPGITVANIDFAMFDTPQLEVLSDASSSHSVLLINHRFILR